jgi:hypothetical protein
VFSGNMHIPLKTHHLSMYGNRSFFLTFRRCLDVIRFDYFYHDVQNTIKPLKLATLANRPSVGDGHTLRNRQILVTLYIYINITSWLRHLKTWATVSYVALCVKYELNLPMLAIRKYYVVCVSYCTGAEILIR